MCNRKIQKLKNRSWRCHERLKGIREQLDTEKVSYATSFFAIAWREISSHIHRIFSRRDGASWRPEVKWHTSAVIANKINDPQAVENRNKTLFSSCDIDILYAELSWLVLQEVFDVFVAHECAKNLNFFENWLSDALCWSVVEMISTRESWARLQTSVTFIRFLLKTD